MARMNLSNWPTRFLSTDPICDIPLPDVSTDQSDGWICRFGPRGFPKMGADCRNSRNSMQVSHRSRASQVGIKRSFHAQAMNWIHKTVSSPRQILSQFATMKPSYLFLFILSVSLASSQKTFTHTRICQEYFIPINVTSQVLVSSYVPFKSNYDVVEFVNNITRRNTTTAFVPFSGIKNVTASYTIGATLCVPKENSKKNTTLIVASHGLGYDRRFVSKRENGKSRSVLMTPGTGTRNSSLQITAL